LPDSRGNEMPLDHAARPRTATEVLIVEPESQCRDYLASLLDSDDDTVVMAVGGFLEARRWLEHREPDLLITNLRLEAHNGINLALLVDQRQTTSIVYTATHNIGTARDVQQAGAFYELLDVLPTVLPTYVQQIATERDRRRSICGG
jgi:DNA-binding NtrC family response regulator